MKRRSLSHAVSISFLCIIFIFLMNGAVSALSIQGISDKPAEEVRVGDITTGYKEFGSGEPLIMIMGFSGAMDIWDPVVLNNLSSEYRVIIFDNRGVGDTSDSGKEYSIPQFAQDTAGLMDALNISEADILGWSMGSLVALEFATRYPDRVDKLILYAADPGGKEAIDPEPKVLSQLSNSSGTPEERGERLLSLIFPSEWMAKHQDPREYFPNATEPVNLTAVSGQIKAVNEWEGVYDKLGSIQSPTLLITGTEDIITPPENSVLIAADIPTSQVIQIKDGGHGVMYQYPEEFSRYVLEFLNNTSVQGE